MGEATRPAIGPDDPLAGAAASRIEMLSTQLDGDRLGGRHIAERAGDRSVGRDLRRSKPTDASPDLVADRRQRGKREHDRTLASEERECSPRVRQAD